ncbi:MAG: hypothetical protein MZV70_42405 [Desulfobacterales bacterium]|nr:hypothetical protein [Desulfobacterales bacterium]
MTKQIDRGQQPEQQPQAVPDRDDSACPCSRPRRRSRLLRARYPTRGGASIQEDRLLPLHHPHILLAEQEGRLAPATGRSTRSSIRCFITKIDLGATGIWYRVDVRGLFASQMEAVSRMSDLQDAGHHGHGVLYRIQQCPMPSSSGVLPDRARASGEGGQASRQQGVVTYIMKESESAFRLSGRGISRPARALHRHSNDLTAMGLHAEDRQEMSHALIDSFLEYLVAERSSPENTLSVLCNRPGGP